MQAAGLDIGALKSRLKAMWMAGDFGQIALYTAEQAERFVDALGLAAGTRYLDVACGTGNTAIPAARRGAIVTGVDIATNLLQQARERARREGVTARFEEGDAEQLAFPDGHFDVVLSMFGAMFAPRPQLVARELVRVCRPGGLIVMANWTPSSLAGKMFQLTAKYVPPPPGVPPPSLWGDEGTVRERLQGTSEIVTTRRAVVINYPFPPAAVVDLFRRYFGPTQKAFEVLDEGGQKAMAAECERLFAANNEATDGTTRLAMDFLEVRARRAN